MSKVIAATPSRSTGRSAVARPPAPRSSGGVSPDGEVLGAGLEFVTLAADGRIATDYQFVE